jgi:DNA-binding PadR family transcriptional regulator
MSIRQGLLALLNDQPKYGYQLKTEFESATGGMWPVNVGQVYTTLDRLVRDGFVEADEHEEQKRYKLTLDGYHQLGRWWQAVPEEEPPPRDELMVKVLLAIATTPDQALDVVTAQRTAVFELLQHRRRTQRAAMADHASTAQLLAEDALVVRAEADLRWLDLCEARIQAAAGASLDGAVVGEAAVDEVAVDEAVGDGEVRAPTKRRRSGTKGRRA